MQALSEFADYVQKQQALRTLPIQTGNGTVKAPVTEEHAELDILDTLDLADDRPRVRLKELFLDQSENAEESISQLKDVVHARLDEGHGECLFDVGLEDNGDSMALSTEEWDASLARLQAVLGKLKADWKILLTKNVPNSEVEIEQEKKEKGCVGKIMIRRRPESVDDVIETRIAVVGNVDAGKSTLLGVLVKGGLDDGRGKARVNLFRHKHEVESGRTSSVGMEIMGFDSKGEVVVSAVPGRKLSWEEIGKRSAKVISFTDLAGHERYDGKQPFANYATEAFIC